MATDTLSADRQVKDWREGRTWPARWTTVSYLIQFIGTPLFKLVARVELIGFDNLPDGPFILASNHINNFDVPAMCAYLPRPPLFMAKEELFQNAMLGWIFRMSGSFPVKRGEYDSWAMRQAGRVLGAGQMLTMFPEGTRGGKKAQLRRGKPGTVMLALENSVPIVPMAIFGTQHVRIGKVRPRVTLQAGEPFDVAHHAGPPPHEPAAIRELTTMLMKRIAAMLPPDHRGFYAK